MAFCVGAPTASRRIGSSASGYEKTDRYAQSIVGQGNRLDLDEAIALSGAAVSPSQNQNLLVALLMFCLNLRLGQWLPNLSVPARKWASIPEPGEPFWKVTIPVGDRVRRSRMAD